MKRKGMKKWYNKKRRQPPPPRRSKEDEVDKATSSISVRDIIELEWEDDTHTEIDR